MSVEKTSFGEISLDSVIQNILDNMGGDMPPFMDKCEKDIMGEIEDYTREVMRQNGKNATRIAEDHAGGLLDSICMANHKYFKLGMKAGASLILQLLRG